MWFLDSIFPTENELLKQERERKREREKLTRSFKKEAKARGGGTKRERERKLLSLSVFFGSVFVREERAAEQTERRAFLDTHFFFPALCVVTFWEEEFYIRYINICERHRSRREYLCPLLLALLLFCR